MSQFRGLDYGMAGAGANPFTAGAMNFGGFPDQFPTAYNYNGQPIKQGYWNGDQFMLPPVAALARQAPGQPQTPAPTTGTPDISGIITPPSGDNDHGGENGFGEGSASQGDGSFSLGNSAGGKTGLSAAAGGGMLGQMFSQFTGIPGGSLIGGAIGTGFDVNKMNNTLSGMGMGRPAEWGPAMLASTLNPFGVFGKDGWLPGGASVETQGANRMGMDIGAFHDLITPDRSLDPYLGTHTGQELIDIANKQGQTGVAAAGSPAPSGAQVGTVSGNTNFLNGQQDGATAESQAAQAGATFDFNQSLTDAYGESGTGSGTGDSVICTELYRRGLISREIWQADEAFGRSLPRAVIVGYHRWARPFTRLMQSNRIAFKIGAFIGTAWAHEMAARQGVDGARSSLRGRVILAVFVPLCALIGRLMVFQLASFFRPQRLAP